jgi:CDP-6-deoxy-D-xylo-4-hexulose-3-dehydrase
MSEKITLVKDTIDMNDVNKLIDWLKTNPRLTKGDLTIEFEKKWSEWLGTKYSVFVNSGSSANLASIYSLILSGKLKNNKIVVPAVSWVTTVTPAIQLGLEPIMCECDMDNLGLDINNLKEII